MEEMCYQLVGILKNISISVQNNKAAELDQEQSTIFNSLFLAVKNVQNPVLWGVPVQILLHISALIQWVYCRDVSNKISFHNSLVNTSF